MALRELKDPTNLHRGATSKHQVPRGSGYKVVCPSCRQTFHTTTMLYDSKKKAHGAMFHLLPELGPKGANWTAFPEHKDTDMGELVCPGCGVQYGDDKGMVTSVAKHKYIKEITSEFECLMCGKKLKSKSGLTMHMRHCTGGK